MAPRRSKTAARPPFIRHWSELERSRPELHWHTKEPMLRSSPLSDAFELRRIVVRHDTIMPGWRSAPPHAERDEEEMVFVLEGAPDLWLDGRLYRLHEGLAAGWPGRDGIAHCLINNTDRPVRMLTIGETSRDNSKVVFPVTPEVAAAARRNGNLWLDAPRRRLGPHDGVPDALRLRASASSRRSRPLPASVVDWRAIRGEGTTYPGDDERMSMWSHLSVALGLTRIGVGHDFLPPGRRTSWPHAEYDEEEFVYVVEGEPDAWIDGHLHRLRPGDAAGFPDRTGIAHCFINNTDRPVRLVTVGEASRRRSKCIYPLHPERNREIGEDLWKNAPARKLGPHDGMSDLRRQELAGASKRRKR